METTIIGIGGINLRINLPDRSFQLYESYLPFRVHSAPTTVKWEVHPEPIPNSIILLENRSKTVRIWDINQSNGKLIFRLWWQPDALYPWKAAVMEPAGSRVDIWLNRREEETVSCPLFIIDLLFFPYLLIVRDGIIIHAAAVKIGEEAYLFPAPSGGGKSTWSEMMKSQPGWTVLGEDKVVVRKIGDSYQVFGTPWNPRPEYRSTDHAPLKGIYFLGHSRENRLSEMGRAEVAEKLLQAAALPFQKRDELDKALTIIKEIAGSVPARRFGFFPEQSAVAYFSLKK